MAADIRRFIDAHIEEYIQKRPDEVGVPQALRDLSDCLSEVSQAGAALWADF